MSAANAWIGKLDDEENFLAVYDVLIDLKKEIAISLPDQVFIPIWQPLIKFSELFPWNVDNPGGRDHYCRLRLKATTFLQRHGIITAFHLVESSHRWENHISILAAEATVRDALDQMHSAYKTRYDIEQQDLQGQSPSGRKVFIGHGRSNAWLELNVFLRERLKVDVDEFNRVPVAGTTIPERLQTLLDEASFALLGMTAEDETTDGKMHPRDNVIHEAGLFQGRLGFRRAIVLLEEGCEVFSNIHGLVRVAFPKGGIKSIFEDIRGLLEREGLIKPIT